MLVARGDRAFFNGVAPLGNFPLMFGQVTELKHGVPHTNRRHRNKRRLVEKKDASGREGRMEEEDGG